MAHLRIEFDRGNGWEIRSEGPCDAPVEQIAASLPGYAVQFRHRAVLDGVVVATVEAGARE